MINSRKIEDLTPKAREACIKLLELFKQNGINCRVVQTLRDAEYQTSLYQIGRRGIKGEKTVTPLDGIKKKSRHQSGKAFDIAIFDDKGQPVWVDKRYKVMADLARSIGIIPGYYFKSIDADHFEVL